MTWTDTKSTGSTLTAVEYNNLADHVRPTATATVAKSEPADYVTTNYGSDDACIQAAIDYVNGIGGGSVLIREGTYTISASDSVLPKSDMIISGVGVGTILKKASSASTNSHIIYINGESNITISNMRLNGDKTNQSNLFDNIRVFNASNIIIEKNYVENAERTGIYLDANVNSSKISKNKVMSSSVQAINVNGRSNTIIDNYVDGTDSDFAIVIGEGYNISAIGNYVQNGYWDGIECGYGVEGAVIVGNQVKDCRSGITVYMKIAPNFGTITHAKNIIISGNSIHSCSEYGILVITQTLPITSCLISNNIIENTTLDAFYVKGLVTHGIEFVEIVGNIVDDITRNGFNVSYIDNININNNIFGTCSSGVAVRSNNTNTRIYNNMGHNPYGNFTAPSVPASTVNYTNNYGCPCQVQVYGGTVTEIDIDDIATGLTSGVFMIPPGGTINITYSAAPSWRWWGL